MTKNKRVDVLVAEIGSTTTVVNAFKDLDTPCPVFLGQGVAPTSVLEGDVTVGLSQAIGDLKEHLQVKTLMWDEMVATSSAAGGLRMTVHGLVYDMTVRAAKEAALGAGAVIRMITARDLTDYDLDKFSQERPNIVLLAGGVDHGEKRTVIYNAQRLAPLLEDIPVIFAGNTAATNEVQAIFQQHKVRAYYVENVYPRIDQLNVDPTRKVIQEVFEEHIVHAPGMEKIRSMIKGRIMPTPGAVMEATRLLYHYLGDVVVIDVGGATTDVHSVTPGSERINKILLNPEPLAKRTVEGDLGVYVNVHNLVDLVGGQEQLAQQIEGDVGSSLTHWQPLPQDKIAQDILHVLTEGAVKTAIGRHAGEIRHLYGPSGRIVLAEGKDLTAVKYIIGTGGPLTSLPKRQTILNTVRQSESSLKLMPPIEAKILIDCHYNMAVLGVLSTHYPEGALKLLLNSLGIQGGGR